MKTKLYKNLIKEKVASPKLSVVCLLGFLCQTCIKSEVVLNTEPLSNAISICKTTGVEAMKDEVERSKNSNTDSSDIVVADSLKSSVSTNINTDLTSVLNRRNASGNHNVADSVSINTGTNQHTGNPPTDTPIVILPSVSKPIGVISPPPTIHNDDVVPKISVKTSQGVILHPPKNLLIGLSKAYPLAIDTYTGLLNQMPGGENEFWFYGKTNQYAYPQGDWITQQNGYSTIDLPTHAINARAGSDSQHPEYNGIICKIEYTIKDPQGNVVMYCKDTKGGFHSAFIPNERGNNHPKESQRFLPYGTYTVEFKNLTNGNLNAPIRVTYNRAGGYMGEYFDAVVDNQQTISFSIEVFEQGQDISMFKLNCNMVP